MPNESIEDIIRRVIREELDRRMIPYPLNPQPLPYNPWPYNPYKDRTGDPNPFYGPTIT